MDRGFSGAGMDEGGGSEGANKLAAIQAQLNSRFQQVLDKLTPRTHVRWGIFAFVVLLYALRVRLLEVSRVAGNHPPSRHVQCALGSFVASVRSRPPKPYPEVRRTDEVPPADWKEASSTRTSQHRPAHLGAPAAHRLTALHRDLVQRACGASVGVRLDWLSSDRVGGAVPGLLHRDLRSGHLSSQPTDWLPVAHGGS